MLQGNASKSQPCNLTVIIIIIIIMKQKCLALGMRIWKNRSVTGIYRIYFYLHICNKSSIILLCLRFRYNRKIFQLFFIFHVRNFKFEQCNMLSTSKIPDNWTKVWVKRMVTPTEKQKLILTNKNIIKIYVLENSNIKLYT